MSSSVRTFAVHYLEMVVAMFAGMLVLGLPAEIALGAMGVDLQTDAPQLALLGMATTMTVPMVAWMWFRGHGARPSAEMALSMYLPTFAAMALLAGGALASVHAAMGVQHAVMLPAMLVAMLLRPAEYTAHAHHARVAA
jgi:hypothetical protein